MKIKCSNIKELKDNILGEWSWLIHYIDSVINQVYSIVRYWIKRYNFGKTYKPHKIKNRAIYIKNTLFTVKDNITRISLIPNQRYLEVNLKKLQVYSEGLYRNRWIDILAEKKGVSH